MKIKQDPVTGLYCREDGAVLMPPDGRRFKKYHWSFGSPKSNGYMEIKYAGRFWLVHRIICRAFHGLPPADKPEVDHSDRNRMNNVPGNIKWCSRSENMRNRPQSDECLKWLGQYAADMAPAAYARALRKKNPEYRERQKACMRAYDKVHGAAKRAEKKAQGLSYRKGLDGKFGWFPRVHKSEAV